MFNQPSPQIASIAYIPSFIIRVFQNIDVIHVVDIAAKNEFLQIHLAANHVARKELRSFARFTRLTFETGFDRMGL